MKKKYFIIVLSVILLALLLFAINKTFTTKEDSINLRHLKSNTLLKLKPARDKESQTQGLMFVSTLEPNTGMFFIFPDEVKRSFWMKNTLISLDIIFLDSNLKVTDFYDNTKPNQTSEIYSSSKPSRYVIEVDSKQYTVNNIGQGDEFRIE